jgi:23S rRNA U2552 (ribose-2'-O)-methylase RlmE/FtsJ
MFAVEWPITRASYRETNNLHSLTPTPTMLKLDRLRSCVPKIRTQHGKHAWDREISRFPGVCLPNPRQPTISRAYHKMQEILQSCCLRVPVRSIHLCESPGGFVQALSTHTLPEWTWVAVSLPSLDERVPKPRFDLLPTDRGVFVEGDVLDDSFVDAFVSEHVDGPGRPAELVTADGASDMDHDRLEQEHFPLLLAQSRLALRCLGKGGTFVVKFFEGYCHETQMWIAWITHCFQQVSIIKPTTSRPTNSERYLVARGFVGGTDGLVLPCAIPDFQKCIAAEGWQASLQSTLDSMAKEQCLALESIISRLPIL